MLQNILSALIVLGALYMVISVPVGLVNVKLFKALHGARCTGVNALLAFIPIYNIVFGRKLVYGKATFTKVILALCTALLAFRAISVLLVAAYPILVVYSAITSILVCAVYWLLYIVNAVDLGRMFGVGAITMLCCVLIAPVGYYMLSAQIMAYFRSVEDEVSGTFEAEN